MRTADIDVEVLDRVAFCSDRPLFPTRLGRALIDEHGASSLDFHMIGHSLGAHIAGYAARNVSNVGRVTGQSNTHR